MAQADGNDWEAVGTRFVSAARQLEMLGAEEAKRLEEAAAAPHDKSPTAAETQLRTTGGGQAGAEVLQEEEVVEPLLGLHVGRHVGGGDGGGGSRSSHAVDATGHGAVHTSLSTELRTARRMYAACDSLSHPRP